MQAALRPRCKYWQQFFTSQLHCPSILPEPFVLSAAPPLRPKRNLTCPSLSWLTILVPLAIDKESSKTELEFKYKHILDADALLGTIDGHGVARMLMDYNKTFDQREILDGQIFRDAGALVGQDSKSTICRRLLAVYGSPVLRWLAKSRLGVQVV